MSHDERTQSGNVPEGSHTILNVNITDKAALYSAYMSFVKNGGLFIPTNKRYQAGEEVFMLLKLPEHDDKLPVAGSVIWVTPLAAQGNRPAGIGVQFAEEDELEVRDKIETYLAGMLGTDAPTHTM